MTSIRLFLSSSFPSLPQQTNRKKERKEHKNVYSHSTWDDPLCGRRLRATPESFRRSAIRSVLILLDDPIPKTCVPKLQMFFASTLDLLKDRDPLFFYGKRWRWSENDLLNRSYLTLDSVLNVVLLKGCLDLCIEYSYNMY